MRNFLFLIVIFLGLVGQGLAQVPALSGRINDNANVLTSAQIKKLEEKIKVVEARPDKPQIAVLILQKLPDNTEIDQFTNDVFNTWKLGASGKDNGILILLSLNERQIRIEVGYGLEGSIPDSVAATIIDGMKPKLGKKEYAPALEGAVAEIIKRLEIPVSDKKPGEVDWFLILIIIGGVVVVLIIMSAIFGIEFTFNLILIIIQALLSKGGDSSGGGGGSSGGGGNSSKW